MDLLSYLTTPAAGVGPLVWVFFIAQVLVAIAGIYLAFMNGESHPVRERALRLLGFALLAVGLVGAIVGALRISGVAPFTMPVWITVATLLNLVLVAIALYYARSVFPRQLAAYTQSHRGRGPRPQVTSLGNTSRASVRAPSPARPSPAPSAARAQRDDDENGSARPAAPPSGRRESRRERKRRNR